MILINNQIHIPKCPEDVKKNLVRELSLSNPKFLSASNMDLRAADFMDRVLKFYEYNKRTRTLSVPIGMLETVKALLPKEKYVDKRLKTNKLPFPDISFDGKMRDYQEDVISSLDKNDNGIVEAMTGAGKTIIMINHIVKQQRYTLVMVNTIELANQFIDKLTKFTNLNKDDIGLIGNGKKVIRPITVCILQTIVRLDDDYIDLLNQYFPQILTDEVHIIGAETYYEALNKLTAKYKYGFSATPKRDDGLTLALKFATGPKIHEVPRSKLKNTLLMPSYEILNTEYYFPLFNTSEFQSMITDMAVDVDRNQLIIDKAKEYKTQQIVILCNRAAQVLYLHSKLKGSEYLLSQIPELTDKWKPRYKNGKAISKTMKKKDREAVIDRLNSGKTRIIISTYGLFSTGIDISTLEIMLLGSPIKSETKLKQSLGRLMRKGHKGKSPAVIDFVDPKVELLKWQGKTRSRIIRKAIEN